MVKDVGFDISAESTASLIASGSVDSGSLQTLHTSESPGCIEFPAGVISRAGESFGRTRLRYKSLILFAELADGVD